MLIARDPDGWIIVLQPENLARMKQGDPVTIPDLRLTICFEELKEDALVEKVRTNPRKFLTRGWQNHPDDYGEPKRVITTTTVGGVGPHPIGAQFGDEQFRNRVSGWAVSPQI